MKTLSHTLTALGLVLVIVTGVLAFAARSLPVTLLSEPREAEKTVQTLVDALNQGDLAQASLVLYGQPSLEEQPNFDNPFLTTVWGRYLDSLTCQVEGDCIASDSGLSQSILMETLDIQGALPQVEHRYGELLPLRAQSQTSGTVYNADGGYREEFVLSVLDEATREILSQDCPTIRRNVTLTLVYRENRWWVLPQEGLMDILSGGFAGKEG